MRGRRVVYGTFREKRFRLGGLDNRPDGGCGHPAGVVVRDRSERGICENWPT
jgi:hypothetical protein